jgi:competence protein ComFB
VDLDLGHLENLQVDLVRQALKETLSDVESPVSEKLCTCRFCLVDVIAVALNSLPPRYVADKYYKFPEEKDGEGRALSIARRAVTLAIHKVIRRPHHDR